MARDLTAGVNTETAAPDKRAAAFVHFAFDSGNVYLWSGVGSIVTTGSLGTLPNATWTGVGTLGSIGAVEETAELRATGCVFTLSGADTSVISLALSEHVQGRPVTWWLAFFDDNWAMLDAPIQVFKGRMDTMEIAEDGPTCIVRLTAENRLIDFERPANPRFYTAEDQKRLYPGDKGLDYVQSLQEKTIYWGRHVLKPAKPVQPVTGSPPGEGAGRGPQGGGSGGPSIGGGGGVGAGRGAGQSRSGVAG